jgi:predicted nucleotide-binding protein
MTGCAANTGLDAGVLVRYRRACGYLGAAVGDPRDNVLLSEPGNIVDRLARERAAILAEAYGEGRNPETISGWMGS